MMKTEHVAGLILAGGLARRMGGGDKPLVMAQGRTLLDRVIERIRPQVGPLILNANGDPDRFAHLGLPVAGDVLDGYGGPLVGVLTGLEYLACHHPHIRWMVSVAADTPLFPADLVTRFMDAASADKARLAVARSGDQTHPVFGLWSVDLAGDLRAALVDEGLRRIDRWTARYPLAVVDWPTTPTDPFFNVNTPEDVQQLEQLLGD
jgi:molybdopterin-guanine dinucleotide biosynthesis protein A